MDKHIDEEAPNVGFSSILGMLILYSLRFEITSLYLVTFTCDEPNKYVFKARYKHSNRRTEGECIWNDNLYRISIFKIDILRHYIDIQK